MNQTAERITVTTTVHAPIEKVWQFWNTPEHVMQWNNASDDWHTPKASNNVTEGGTFSYTMAAKDGSFSFDLNGNYTRVKEFETVEFSLEDGRKVSVQFTVDGDHVNIMESFEPEQTNSRELQQAGWQAILDNFKRYTESV